jgi:tryptophanyl-tRNA synthetase
MSKSYGNTIPLFLPEKQLKKSINKILTNLLEPGEPKDPDTAPVFQIWQAFATPEQTAYMREEFAKGIAWGEAKRQLFELINSHIAEPREKYESLMSNPKFIEEKLQQGATKARERSKPFLEKLRESVGIKKIK